MTRSSLWSLWSIIMTTLLIGFILLVIFWVANANAQFLSPASPDYLSIYALQALSSPIHQYAFGIPVQVPLNGSLVSQAINSGFYPNATYFGAPTSLSISGGQYISNATGYYAIESSSTCTCNLP